MKQALLTCMDPRIDVNKVLAALESLPSWSRDPSPYVVRNAGAVATDGVVRSLIMVQRLPVSAPPSPLRIAVVGHEATTPCAMTTMTDDEMDVRLQADLGMTPPFALGFFKADPGLGVRRSMQRLLTSPFLDPPKVVLGFVYNTETNGLRAIEPR